MKKIIKLVYSTLAVLMLLVEPVFSAPDEDPVASKKAKKTTTVIVKAADSDNDGVPDKEDECPNIPGLAATKGCPDSDGDGIPDHLDDCPTVAGIGQFKGCPDSDFDGIPDNKDVCPYEAGIASNNGCPLPEKGQGDYTSKGTRVLDTISLDEERDLQIMRYERYVAEQEHKRQEYIEQLINNNRINNAQSAIEIPSAGDKKPPVIADNVAEVKTNDAETVVKEEIAVVDTAPINPLITLSTVKIDNPMYMSYKPKLEELLKKMRFQDGRVRFTDENKFFDALSELASYCNAYPEWNVTLRCYSNETDNAFGNKQLFSNRVHILKQILVDDLLVPAQRLSFVNNISHTSEISNFISLEIAVK
ncbi:MAG: thrombospondin type 3 repeat-containing protein [Prevotellaceae bacterium]|jgi:hypothetical protein|nr:thrombospondin type 3 repeat-containing protein [Prevotellaceae bacterium]